MLLRFFGFPLFLANYISRFRPFFALETFKVAQINDFEISLASNMLKSVIDNNGQVMDISPSA